MGYTDPAKRRAYAAGWRQRNRERLRARRKVWDAENRERNRGYRLKYKFGLSLADYAAMLESQGNGCAICGRSDSRLHVDHDHDTGRIRGLLCGHCNRALGLLGDSRERVARAAEYLRKKPLNRR